MNDQSDAPVSEIRGITGTVFYAVLAWQKERGRTSLFRGTRDDDIPTLDNIMAELEAMFIKQTAPDHPIRENN